MYPTLVALGVLATACGSGAGSSTEAAPRLPGASVSVQSGFAGNETFCSIEPLTGTIHYTVSTGEARLRLGVGGLPASTTVLVNWLNNSIRGYVIGEFATNSAGYSVNSTSRLYRPGETRGYEIQLSSSDSEATVIGVLRPCG
jgi:hypothetical protein